MATMMSAEIERKGLLNSSFGIPTRYDEDEDNVSDEDQPDCQSGDKPLQVNVATLAGRFEVQIKNQTLRFTTRGSAVLVATSVGLSAATVLVSPIFFIIEVISQSYLMHAILTLNVCRCALFRL